MGSQAPMENIMVVFDFDKTIVDVDTDNWVLDQLGFTDMFNQLLPTMPWNPLMVSFSLFFLCFSFFFFFPLLLIDINIYGLFFSTLFLLINKYKCTK